MLFENAMKNVLMDLVDATAKTHHFIDATEADRDEIKAALLNGLKSKLKSKYNETLDDDYISAYLGNYLDVVADHIIKGDIVNECDSFSIGVGGPLGLNNGIPQGGDGKGVIAKPLFQPKKKKKKKFNVVVKRP